MHDFFIGIRLPQELEETCERYRRMFKAPRTVAHITLIAPFTWEKSKKDLETVLKMAVRSNGPFHITGSDLGSFGTKVLFINVDLNRELSSLQEALARSLRTEGVLVDDRPYHPHITLATRITSQQFARYKSALEDFKPNYAFRCEEITLFQMTKERRWLDCAKIHLGGKIL
ncbi:MAG: RNA 2',3'-cyclic phosphodiesterase [Firmicutes bacterium]|nr:RNA 2',3'-cyclic phosphodiesterase [Bacillota bacterium]